jgi:integrase
MTCRKRTRYPGVYERKTIDRSGHEDVTYDIAFRHNHKLIWEKIGRKSEGVNAAFASRVRAEKIKKIENNQYVPEAGMMTLDQAATRYFDIHMKGKPSEYTTRSHYATHIRDAIGQFPMNKILPLHIEEIKRRMSDARLAPQTIKHTLGLIRRIYRRMTAWGLYAGNIPTNGVQIPKVDAARLRFLTREEAKILLRELKKHSQTWHDIAFISLNTGMRLREILALRLGHINRPAGIINIMDAKSGTRQAYITDAVWQVLSRRITGKNKDDFVFEKPGGGKILYVSPIYPKIAGKLFNSGITDARHRVVFHTLRHTFASWLAQKGVPLYTISELLGHASLDMTKRYSKLSPDTKKDALKMLPTFTELSDDND